MVWDVEGYGLGADGRALQVVKHNERQVFFVFFGHVHLGGPYLS